MPQMTPKETLAEDARRKVGETARAMLRGDMSFLEGARLITSLRFDAGLKSDPDILPFVAIESETDALPLGRQRELWSANALATLEPELEAAEKFAGEQLRSSCETFATRF